MAAVVLGPVAFDDFEVPARIPFGGRQQIHVHTLVGGQRVIDAMGVDDSPIGWSGVFSGGDAVSRARTLDALRIAGVELLLAWDAFVYTVVIASFEARFERTNWIPYNISCVVAFDEAAAIVQAATSLLDAVAADLSSAALASGFDLSVATAALGLPAAGAQRSADAATASAALDQAAIGMDDAIASAGTSLAAAGDVPSAVQAAGQLAQLASARGFMRRARANFNMAGA